MPANRTSTIPYLMGYQDFPQLWVQGIAYEHYVTMRFRIAEPQNCQCATCVKMEKIIAQAFTENETEHATPHGGWV